MVLEHISQYLPRPNQRKHYCHGVKEGIFYWLGFGVTWVLVGTGLQVPVGVREVLVKVDGQTLGEHLQKECLD